ncbi:MAG TPA: M20/M25/M40 family metallo-hydrolase [Herpetosiphonaceae bacterium]
MEDQSLHLLQRLLTAAAPSGHESAAAQVWLAAAQSFADRVHVDVYGSAYAWLQGGSLRVLLSGHIDEIGLMISYIDDAGYIAVDSIGRWDAQVLVGQRVRILGRQGELVGVVGKPPIQLLRPEDRGRASTLEELWLDIGARSREEAEALVRIGDVAVIDAPLHELLARRIVARSSDNRVGAFVVLEALRLLARERADVTVAAVATSQEETTHAGASMATFHVEPHISLVVDVTFSSDSPGADKKMLGNVQLGGGPVLSRGGANSPVIYDLLVAAAEQQGIPYSVQVTPHDTGTDADVTYLSRSGVATALIGIPSRYMHSPNTMVDLDDLTYTIKLIVAFVRMLSNNLDLCPYQVGTPPAIEQPAFAAQ